MQCENNACSRKWYVDVFDLRAFQSILNTFKILIHVLSFLVRVNVWNAISRNLGEGAVGGDGEGR